MAVALNRPVIRAMAAQLDRVNQHPDGLLDRIQKLESNARIDAITLRAQAAEIERLRERLAAAETPLQAAARHLVDGRPVLTAAQAADQVGVSLATVSRYVHAGFWQATQEPGSRRWLVYADQALARKRKG